MNSRESWVAEALHQDHPVDRDSRESGSVTIVLVGIVSAIILLVSGLTLVGRAVIASERARTASDEAALAGAWVLASGSSGETPCVSAARVADANSAHLTRCAVIADSVQVTVQTRGPLQHRPEAIARAGPSEER